MTAVEWFAIQIMYRPNLSMTEKLEFLNEAKAIEKKQIKDAWLNSLTKGDYNSAEQYYNETFKSE